MSTVRRWTRSVRSRYRSRFAQCAAIIAIALACRSNFAAEPPKSETRAEAAKVDSSAPEFRIGAGDELSIFIYELEKTYDRTLVRPDGRITIPLVGDVSAEGKTPHDLGVELATMLKPFQDPATVTVAVTAIHSYRLFTLGQLRNQSMFESDRPLRLLQALAHAGGFTEFATKTVLVLRDGPKGQERIVIDVDKIISGKTPDQDIWLKSGDLVVAQ